MAESLRDQLLRIGIATEEHAKRADAPKARSDNKRGPSQKPSAKKRKPKDNAAKHKSQPPKAVKPAKAAKAQPTEDPAIIAQKRQVKADIKALIEANSMPEFRGEMPFYYRVDDRIRQMLMTEAARDLMVAGQAVITRLNRVTHLISLETAQQVKALNDQWLLIRHEPGQEQPKPEDDPYAGFDVPDDLIW